MDMSLIPNIIIIIITAFLLKIPGSVSGHVTKIPIEASKGTSVVFPCNLTSKNEHITAIWRGINDQSVYQAVKGKEISSNQSEKYKNRVELGKDNCSIILKNVTKSDEGLYNGYIFLPDNKEIQINLTITEPEKGRNKEILHKKEPPSTTSYSINLEHIHIFCGIFGVVFVVVVVIIMIKKVMLTRAWRGERLQIRDSFPPEQLEMV